MCTIFEAADYIVYSCVIEKPLGITPLKLQKLLYFAQAYSFHTTGEALFEEDFEAWVHGPANYSIYKNYIINLDKFKEEARFYFTDYEIFVLNGTVAMFGEMTGAQLEYISHQEVPWIEARGSLKSWERSNAIISKNSMRKFYYKKS